MTQEATRPFCYGKIHRAVVTDAQVDYVGSITIDPVLLRASGILPYTQVDVVNVNNGNRLQTYVIEGTEGDGNICLNGAAAHFFNKGDLCIIMGYENVPVSQLPNRLHKAVLVNAAKGNVIDSVRELRVPESIEAVGNADRSNEKFSELLNA